MRSVIHTFFESKAHDAMEHSYARASDLTLFKQVKQRIDLGEDLSKELPQLKKLAKKDALAVVKQLIKRCDTDLNTYWTLPDAAKVKTVVKHELFKGELIARFKAEYTFKTKLGAVVIQVHTQGQYVFVGIDTQGVKKANTELALRDVEKQLTLIALR